MCDYRVNRIWIAACLALMLGTGAAVTATGHATSASTLRVAAARSAAVSTSAPLDSGWS